MSTLEQDRNLIADLGGPTKVADLLGYKKEGGVQRVQNWLQRGIPAHVKVDNPSIFLNPPSTVIAGAGLPATTDAQTVEPTSIQLLSPQHATSPHAGPEKKKPASKEERARADERRGRSPRERRQGPIDRRVSERSAAQRAARESKPAKE